MKKMKKLRTKLSYTVCTLLTTFILCSCNPQPKNGSTQTRNGDYSTKVIDGCEYIEYDHGVFDCRVYSLTHKGNCKFCLERSKNK
jgi:hypothetical protein